MLQLQLEVTSFCDSACVFCPYPTMKRPKGAMSMDLFRKIIDEAVDIPQVDHITFTGLGETLLDKNLVERIRYTRKRMPAILIDIYTNGSQLTEAKIDALRDAGLSVMYVSLNAANAEKRKQIMYPHKKDYDDFERVCSMIDYAIANGSPMKTIVKAVVEKDLIEQSEVEEFQVRWGGQWDSPGGHAFIHREGNWAGATYAMRTKPVTPCARALQQIMVLWDGRVSLCCFDGEGQDILGDLNVQGIKEVFNGSRATFVRTSHWEGRRQDIELCANCTAI